LGLQNQKKQSIGPHKQWSKVPLTTWHDYPDTFLLLCFVPTNKRNCTNIEPNYFPLFFPMFR
jgi:hypothetical protein